MTFIIERGCICSFMTALYATLSSLQTSTTVLLSNWRIFLEYDVFRQFQCHFYDVMSQNRQQIMNGRSLETPGLQAWVLNLRFGHRDQVVPVSKSILVIPSSPGRTASRILLWHLQWTVCWSNRFLVSTTTQCVTEVWQRRRAAAQLKCRQPVTCPKMSIHPHAQLWDASSQEHHFPFWV